MTKKMMGYDADDKKIPNYKYDDLGNQEQKEQNKTVLQNIVINPETSNWFKIWNFVRYAVLFYGYFLNMYYLAFYYNLEESEKENTAIWGDSQKDCGISKKDNSKSSYESHQE